MTLKSTNPERANYSLAEGEAIRPGLESMMAIFDVDTALRLEKEWRIQTEPADTTQLQAVALRLALEVGRLRWLLDIEAKRADAEAFGPNVKSNMHKTSDIIAELDHAVFIALRDAPGSSIYGAPIVRDGVFFLRKKDDPFGSPFQPSTNWAHGGPIIQEFVIGLTPFEVAGGVRWGGACETKLNLHQNRNLDSGQPMLFAISSEETALCAAMRAFVEAKLGDTVDL